MIGAQFRVGGEGSEWEGGKEGVRWVSGSRISAGGGGLCGWGGEVWYNGGRGGTWGLRSGSGDEGSI